MKKLILIVLDGLNAETAFAHLGFLSHLIAQNQGSQYTCQTQLPAMSRPLYEVIQSGLPCIQHGILSNQMARRSQTQNLFKRCKENHLRTAAAAYHWICQLYDRYPVDSFSGRFRFAGKDKENSWIDDGIYYFSDDYPLVYTFSDAHYLIQEKNPDYILIHPMSIDYVGHKYGGGAKEYLQSVIEADVCMANLWPVWQSLGYDIVVTADHGMNEWGFHNGDNATESQVPLYLFSHSYPKGDFREKRISQCQIAPICAGILGLDDLPNLKGEA